MTENKSIDRFKRQTSIISETIALMPYTPISEEPMKEHQHLPRSVISVRFAGFMADEVKGSTVYNRPRSQRI